MTLKNKVNKETGARNGDPITDTFIRFNQAARAVQKFGDAYFFKKLNLSVIQFVMLNALYVKGGTMTPSEIARWTQTERNNITTLVSRLKRDGYITVEKNLQDRRSINVTLTKTGRQVLDKAIPAAEEIIKQVMASIEKSDAVTLEKATKVMRANAQDGLKNLIKNS